LGSEALGWIINETKTAAAATTKKTKIQRRESGLGRKNYNVSYGKKIHTKSSSVLLH